MRRRGICSQRFSLCRRHAVDLPGLHLACIQPWRASAVVCLTASLLALPACKEAPVVKREPTAEAPPPPEPAPSASTSSDVDQECNSLRECQALAHNHRTGRKGLAQDSVRALALFERACSFTRGSEDLGCRHQAFMLREGEGVPKNEAKALEIYKRLCARGAGMQCVSAGRLLAEPTQLAREEASAQAFMQQGFELLGKACDAGNGDACNSLGWMHFTREAPGATVKQAAEALQKSCALKSLGGCDSYAFLLLNGAGVTKDEPEAFRLYSYACKRDVGYACIARGFMLQFGRGTEPNATEAAAAFKEGCLPHVEVDLERACARDGDAWSCGMASMLSATGVCSVIDVDKSRALFRKACQPGYDWYCERFKEHEKSQRK